MGGHRAGTDPTKDPHMTPPNGTDRRTVLKTLGAAGLAGTTLTGVGAARPGQGSPAHAQPELTLTAGHNHETGEHTFDLSTNTLSSGWNTIELHNPTNHTHFGYMAKFPEAAIEDAEAWDMDLLDLYYQTVTRPFQYFMDTLVPGKEPNPADLGPVLELYPDNLYFGLFAPWFPRLEPSGGPGLLSPDGTGLTTMSLDPGEYVVECYIKDANQDFHSYHGMFDQVTITPGGWGSEPRATVDVRIDNAGITVDSPRRPGRHTFGVTFEEQQIYDHLLGHDVHLIRLDGDTDVEDVYQWMDWSNGALTADTSDDVTGLVSDGTEPTTFLGGIQNIRHIPAEDYPETAYFHTVLTPGDYCLVAEIPVPDAQASLVEFSVPARGRGP